LMNFHFLAPVACINSHHLRSFNPDISYLYVNQPPYSLFPIPYSLFPIPYSIPYSVFRIPYSLFPPLPVRDS
jgi:hypothetical protein